MIAALMRYFPLYLGTEITTFPEYEMVAYRLNDELIS